MGTGFVRRNDVWRMLDDCAPGHRREEKLHHWWISFGGRRFTSFPTGRHGARHDPEIRAGFVKHLVRLFGVEDCAALHFPHLFRGGSSEVRERSTRQPRLEEHCVAVVFENESAVEDAKDRQARTRA